MWIKNELLDLSRSFKLYGEQNKRTILTGLSMGEAVISSAAWCRAGYKLHDIIERKKEEFDDCDKDDDDARKAVIFEGISEAAPSVVTATISTALTCVIIGKNHKENSKRIAILTAGYAASESALSALETKMEEILGKRKSDEVKNSVAQDKVNNTDSTVIFSGPGDIWVIDSFSNYKWRSTSEKVKQAINNLNLEIARFKYDFVPLNDLYMALGLKAIPNGDELGFDFSDTFNSRYCELPIRYEAILDDGEPALYLNYHIKVAPDYRGLH